MCKKSRKTSRDEKKNCPLEKKKSITRNANQLPCKYSHQRGTRLIKGPLFRHIFKGQQI